MRAKRRLTIVAILLVGTLSLVAGGPAQAGKTAGLYPDLQTVVPLHLQIQNQQQREILRFSSGIANTGAGGWRMRPVFPLDGSGQQTQDAVQEILDANGNVVREALVSQFEFHA